MNMKRCNSLSILSRMLSLAPSGSTSDIKYQSHLAYAIQELLKFCKFSSDLITPGTSVSNKVRNRWIQLPKHVLETVTPLLEGKFAVHNPSNVVTTGHPVYHGQSTYREWIQCWCTYLISRTNGRMAIAIFDVFRAVLRNRDVGIAHQLLPHLVLNILISGDDEDTRNIQLEISTVLKDQLDPNSSSSSDTEATQFPSKQYFGWPRRYLIDVGYFHAYGPL